MKARWRAAYILVLASGLPALAGEVAPSVSPAKSVAIDNLPRRSIPEGQFLRWCGRNGSFLMARKARSLTMSTYWVQDRSDKDVPTLPQTKGLVECDATGDHLFINENQSVKGTITRFDIKGRTTSTIAIYSTNQFAGGHGISVSPDQTGAAFDTDLAVIDPGEQTGSLKLVPVAHSSGFRSKDSLSWSADSSFVLNAVLVSDDPKNPKLHQEAVQLIDVRSGKEITGNLPSGMWFESGVVLESGHKLLLFMRPSQNEIKADPGTVFTCATAPKFSCRATLAAVDEVSFSDDGAIASIREVMKDPGKRTEGDSVILPVAYVAEVRDRDGKLIANQRFARRKEQLGLRLQLSPASTEVALIWKKWSEARREVVESTSIVSLGAAR